MHKYEEMNPPIIATRPLITRRCRYATDYHKAINVE